MNDILIIFIFIVFYCWFEQGSTPTTHFTNGKLRFRTCVYPSDWQIIMSRKVMHNTSRRYHVFLHWRNNSCWSKYITYFLLTVMYYMVFYCNGWDVDTVRLPLHHNLFFCVERRQGWARVLNIPSCQEDLLLNNKKEYLDSYTSSSCLPIILSGILIKVTSLVSSSILWCR